MYKKKLQSSEKIAGKKKASLDIPGQLPSAQRAGWSQRETRAGFGTIGMLCSSKISMWGVELKDDRAKR